VSLLENYDVLLFDLDGLLIDSLDKLSSGLITAVSRFAKPAELEVFTSYDRTNPGLSRFEKIAYFANEIAKGTKIDQQLILEEFDKESFKARTESRLSDSIFELNKKFKNKIWILLTNCDVRQIDEVASILGLDEIFKNNLIGTPPSKHVQARIIREIYPNSEIISISDSESDGEIARECSFDFLFVEEFSRGDGDWKLDGYYKVSTLNELL
jgi:hypothetical protein